jgi:hypothetical protein
MGFAGGRVTSEVVWGIVCGTEASGVRWTWRLGFSISSSSSW